LCVYWQNKLMITMLLSLGLL